MNFIFYDTETTGANKYFDQVLQFAAILTDENFNKLDQFEIRSRLLPHIIPSPGAMVVTRSSIEQLTSKSHPSHYEMSIRVWQRLKTWPASVYIGYNSLSFDETLLRQTFYQSQLPLFLTNTGGNSRLDMLHIVRAAAALRPGVLEVPVNDGKSSFRLDMLAPANGVDHLDAHDALGDVNATIHLASLVRSRAPELWGWALQYRVKKDANQFASEATVFSHIALHSNRPKIRIVTTIGFNPDNDGELLAFNLLHDPDEVGALADEELAAQVAKRGLVSRIRTNSSPFFLPLEVGATDESYAKIGLDLLKRRANLVKADEFLKKKLVKAAIEQTAPYPSSEILEEQIYDSFYSRADEALMKAFHSMSWSERVALIEKFEDRRIRRLARRIIYCEAPEVLSDIERRSYKKALSERLLGAEKSWTTIDAAADELNSIKAKLGEIPPCLVGYAEHLAGKRLELTDGIVEAGT